MTSMNGGDNDDDGQREKKRQRRLSSSEEEEKKEDPIIGLDVCGKVYYCHQSTLTRNSQYFASRFQGRFNADVAYQDQVTGRDVYFVERCPSLFKHVFAYMISPHDFQLPSFDENPTLWRKLRNEADYFGIDGLCNILNVTHSVSPNPSNHNRGLLYWLGSRRGTSKYENPHEIGVLHVGGWVDVGSKELIRGIHNPRRAGTEYCRKRIVQHRLNLNDMSRTTELTNRDEGDMFYPSLIMFCSHAVERLPVTIDLLKVQIRPTHYSLRSFACYGMAGDWDFDGSFDGTTWDTLHAARDDKNLNLSEREFQDEIRDSLQRSICDDDNEPNDRKADALTSCIEKDYRHTWKLHPEPSKFYRYFRIIGATSNRDGRFFQQCLHGEGLELFGDLRDE